jgi:hypothetical protein
MRLVPGVSVAPGVIASIDSDHDGVISPDEQHRYAERVLADLQLKEDGQNLLLQLTSVTFPTVDQMKMGTGEIEVAPGLSSGYSTNPIRLVKESSAPRIMA